MRTLRRHKASAEGEVDSEGTWAISYGDMITLLLTFFILFFKIDSQAAGDRAAVVQAELMAKLSKGESKQAAAESKQLMNVLGVNPELKVKLDAETFKGGPAVYVAFPGISFFGKGKVDVDYKARESLKHFAEIYKPYSKHSVISIRAFTDGLPVRQLEGRRFSDNLELSALRSVAAMRVLQSHGIPIERMRIAGLGQADYEKKVWPTHGEPMDRKIMITVEPEGQL
jgi:flagellar motor protein MotB